MRILQLISSAGYYGAEAVVVNLSAALRRSECDVVLGIFENAHCPNGELAERAASRGVSTLPVACAGRFDRRGVESVRRVIQECGVDLIHTHGYKADMYGYFAARDTGVPVMATCHNWVGDSLPVRIYDFLDHMTLRQFPHVVAVSEAVRRSLRRYGVRPSRISVVPNGIDVDTFDRGGCEFAEELRKDGKLTIGLVGRLVLDKGGDWLLRAAVEVLRIRPDAMLVFVGEGPARAGLEQMSRELGVAGRVIFTGYRQDMASVYAALDIVVLPSRKEAMPVTLIEAMAAGRPVVATRVGAVDQVVAHGETGLLVDRGDWHGFTQALLCLVNDPAMAATMGQRGRERSAQLFSEDIMATRYLKLYAGLC